MRSPLEEVGWHRSSGRTTTSRLKAYTKSTVETKTADFIAHFMFLIQTPFLMP